MLTTIKIEAPIIAPTPTTGKLTNAPVAANDWAPANNDPLDTSPIPLWITAAVLPATTPPLVNPNPAKAADPANVLAAPTAAPTTVEFMN